MIQARKSDNDLHLIGVASMAYWHGYDRVIEGLHNYYLNGEHDKKKVFFHIAGDSSNAESLRCKELVKKYNLDGYVTFYGRKSGTELDMIFNKADIAVGSLACHRISIKNVRSLKNREYCARGIPFFYSEIDEDFEGKDFVFKVSATDDLIDIEQVVNFTEGNKFDPVQIRRYAFENLTWDKQFQAVLRNVIPNYKTPVKMPLKYGSFSDT